MEAYFSKLSAAANRCFSIARQAREKGLDPEVEVEIPFAEDMASRVEELLAEYNVRGVAGRIRELSEKYNREEMSLIIAGEIAAQDTDNRLEVLERAIRVGLAILTEGILVAPLEGIAGVKLSKNTDGTEYVSLFFSGPIRSAGGTGQALSVLIADVVRRRLGIGAYRATEQEIERFKEEIPLYRQKQHLQYEPAPEEIELIVTNCPICIDGEGTEDEEVSGYRDLPRIATNRLRGGACIVIADGMCQKASKLMKHVNSLKLDGWRFLEKLASKAVSTDDDEERITPSEKYVKDMVAGRPIFCHPSRVGGFRLRYGRGRTTGLAAIAINPATMHVMDSFIAIGTQIKLERPGKAGAVTPCDEVEGPIVLLRNGDVVQINSSDDAIAVLQDISEIIDVGEILIPFGEFLENNHPLVPAGYTIEWHRAILRSKLKKLPPGWEAPSWEEALRMSVEHGVPLHPSFNLFWNDITLSELYELIDYVSTNGRADNGKLFLPLNGCKTTLERLGVLHTVRNGEIVVERQAPPLLLCLGLSASGNSIARVKQPGMFSTTLETVSALAGVTVMARAMTRIGARMARPEKAAERKMKPAPHVLYPLGQDGGMQRLFSEAARKREVTLEMNSRLCPECGKVTYMSLCDCGAHTYSKKESRQYRVDIQKQLSGAMQRIGENRYYDMKGVQGLISSARTPEAVEKGILRAKHSVSTFRDGTVRFDMTDVPLTHFRPDEIHLTVARARELGYTKDINGMELTDGNQLCELRVQDVVPSVKFGDYMKRVADFVDEELEKLYGMEPYYKLSDSLDLIGHLAVGLAPHTSGGILCRIIGFTEANVGYGHPFFHAAKRRNADGDEDSMILLLDALVNFSRSYLPASRGGLMDAPLVLSLMIDPNEIDKEAHNIDLLPEYPLEFYQATERYAKPKEVEKLMDTVGPRVQTLKQYEKFRFTNDTRKIDEGPKESAYSRLGSMQEKLWAQLRLAEKIRAVDAGDVALRVITRHFLPDMIGNLKSFSGQVLRCTKCGSKYRRIPLRGSCYCGHELTLTVHEASVKKYLDVTKEIVRQFKLPLYTVQRIELIERAMDSLFESDGVRMVKLTEFE